jgi:Na+/phosphate symporter
MVTVAGKDFFTPVFNKLEGMVGAARNAFNRHSRKDLEQLKTLHKEVVPEITNTIKLVEGTLAKKPGNERAEGLKAQSVLTRLQLIAEKLGGLIDPIEKKIKEGVLFSEKAVSQTNHLFDHQAGLLRSLLDILKTDNKLLKKFVLDEGQKLIQNCLEFATEHEERMIEGLCLPQAAPLFLTILDNMRAAAQHEVDIVQILGQKA